MPTSHGDLKTLLTLPTKEVRQLWPKVVGQPAPHSIGREFLVAMVAWHQQAHECGGLTHRAQHALKRVKPAEANNTTSRQTVAPPLPVGTVLLKTYQGLRYTVTVQTEGFAFEGTVYTSLSEIARRITGTRWNGPAFFGLRRPSSTQKKKASG